MLLRLHNVTLRDGLCSGSDTGFIRKRKRKRMGAAYARFLRSLLRINLRERQRAIEFQANNVKYPLPTENIVKYI